MHLYQTTELNYTNIQIHGSVQKIQPKFAETTDEIWSMYLIISLLWWIGEQWIILYI